MSNSTRPNPPESEEPNRKHDLFEDPALSKSLEEDPVARFILSHWKNLFVVVLAVLGFFYLRSQIKTTTEVRVAESSETFDKARSSIKDLMEIKEKDAIDRKNADAPAASAAPQATPSQANLDAEKLAKSEKLVRAARDSLSALKDGPEPYALLAPVYEQLLKKTEAGLTESVQSVNADVSIEWSKVTDSSKRLVYELQALESARMLLDSEQTMKKGIADLQKLAQEGQYVRASAVLTLLRVVETPEDISAAVPVAQDVVRLFPEHADKIEIELKRLT